MRLILVLPVCFAAFACQSSQYITRDELKEMLILPAADPGSPIAVQRCDVDALVAGAFSAPEAGGRAASAMAAADERIKPLNDALAAIDRAFEVCANNLANADTTTFKRVVAVSEPGGKAIFRTEFEQGPMENTGRQLDIGIQGRGFFKVRTVGDTFAYTRNGNFFVNKDGNLVLGMGDGYKLEPQISIPKATTDISISNDGKITVIVPGTLSFLHVGQLELYEFTNDQGLKLLGGSLFSATEHAGTIRAAKPGDNGAGQVLQGFLEGSNVDPTKERLRMRFLQNWRATILNAVNESKDKVNSANTHALIKPLKPLVDAQIEPIVASDIAIADPIPSHSRPALTDIDQRRFAPLITALRAIDTGFDVVANNLANAKSIGFKKSRVNLEDIAATSIRQPVITVEGDVSPAGITVGHGVQISNTQLDTEQGSMERTGRQLDIGIQGQGFFKIKINPNIADGFGYTRSGNFFVNKDGNLVSGDGNIIDPGISFPKGITDISISDDGRITVVKPGAVSPISIGQLQLYQFINPQGLNLLGQSIYTQTESSGPPISSKPGENSAGQLLQGYLEASNVDVIRERVRLRFLQNWRENILSIMNDSRQ